MARLLAPRFGAALDQPVLLENMAGVGGIAGVSRVAKAAPDGYQFVLGNVGTHAQNQFLFAYPPYDAMVEFVPAALLVDQAILLAVRADLPIAGLDDFIAHLRANAANMQYASAGFGSPTHLACALLNSALGVDVRHALYRGGSLATREQSVGTDRPGSRSRKILERHDWRVSHGADLRAVPVTDEVRPEGASQESPSRGAGCGVRLLLPRCRDDRTRRRSKHTLGIPVPIRARTNGKSSRRNSRSCGIKSRRSTSSCATWQILTI